MGSPMSTENVPVQGQLWLWVRALHVLEEVAWELHVRFLATGQTLACCQTGSFEVLSRTMKDRVRSSWGSSIAWTGLVLKTG